MNEFLRNRHAFLFSGSVGGTSAAGAQASLGTDGAGQNSDMSSMFEQGMQQQEAMYAQGMQESEEKDEMQTQGDAALKTLKAVSIS